MQCVEPEAGTTGHKSHPSPLSLPPRTLFFLQARMVQQATPLSARRPCLHFCLHFCKSVTRDLLSCSDSTKQNLPFSANRRAGTRVSFLWALAGYCASTDGRNFSLCLFFFFILFYFHFPPLPVPPPSCTIVKTGPCVRACGQSSPSPTAQHTHMHTCGPAPLCLLCPLIYQAAVDQSLLSSPSALHFALSRPLCHYTNSGPLCTVQ